MAKAALHAQEVAAQALIDGLRSGANWHEALAEHQLESHELPQDPAKLSGPIEQGVAMAVFSSPVPSPAEQLMAADVSIRPVTLCSSSMR